MGLLRPQSTETTQSISALGSKNPPSSLLSKFAALHNLRLKRDDCKDWNAIGRAGSICDYGDKVHLLATVIADKGRWWATVSKEARAAGCTITQNGDMEGSFRLDPSDLGQAAVALRAIRSPGERRALQKCA